MSTTDDLAHAESKWLDGWRDGPTRLRWDRVPLQVGDTAPDMELRDHAGNLVSLASYWSDGPAVVMFWRHFGCSCGIDRAARLAAEYQELMDIGANVVIVGQASPDRSAAYRERNNIESPILSDPDLSAYKAFDLLEGTSAQVVFDAGDAILSCDVNAGKEMAASRHGTDRASVDNPWQLPGEFVIDANGIVQLAYRYQYCEDWPDPRVLTAAIRFGGAPTV